MLEDVLPKINRGGNEDLNLFTTTVHGMRSVLLNLGETESAAVALKLEQAGNAERTEEILTDTPSFINTLRATIEKYKPKATDKADDISDDDMVVLKERLSEIKTACERFQKKAIKKALDDLKGKTWSRNINELLDEISTYLLKGEYKKIVSIVEKTTF